MRTMPLAGDYAAAVQNPGFCFTDEVLRRAVIRKNNLGQPRAMSGQFSVVFPMTTRDGQRHAVKCFTHDAPGQLHRYELIYQGLTSLRPRWATDFTYQHDGIKVEGETYPVLRMDWVEGVSLLTWLDSHRDAASIGRLADEFDRLVGELSGAGVAHGDLQHGNILVQPDGTLRLIDYDGIFLPGVGLERYPSDETGLPDYQPPGRTAADYGPDMDRFSAWLISLSLRALAVGPSLLDTLNPSRGEYLLLDRGDFADPLASEALSLLRARPDPAARELVTTVRTLLALPLDQIPAPGSPLPDLGPEPVPIRQRPRSAPPRRRQPAVPKSGTPEWLASARAAHAAVIAEPKPPVSTAGTPAQRPRTPRPPSPGTRGSGLGRTAPRRLAPHLGRRGAGTIVAIVAVLGIILGVTLHPGNPGPLTPLPGGTDFLLANGDVFDLGGDGSFTLVNSSGDYLWSAVSPDGDPEAGSAPYTEAQLSDEGCVAALTWEGAEIVNPGSRAYYTMPNAENGVIVSGSNGMWSDGNVTDLCTGRGTVGTVSPGSSGLPECLDGETAVTQTGTYESPTGIEAWNYGDKLWSARGSYNVVCDPERGTVARLDNATNTVDVINLGTGKPVWKSPEPGCVSRGNAECVTNAPAPVSLSDAFGNVILAAPGAVLAYDINRGRPVWHKGGVCELATHDEPRPELLLGPCDGTLRSGARALVVNPETGAVTKTLNLGASDQWAANVNDLLAVDSNGTFRELPW